MQRRAVDVRRRPGTAARGGAARRRRYRGRRGRGADRPRAQLRAPHPHGRRRQADGRWHGHFRRRSHPTDRWTSRAARMTGGSRPAARRPRRKASQRLCGRDIETLAAREYGRRMRSRLIALSAAFAVLPLVPSAGVAPAAAATGDIGSADHSYGALTRSPTGSKPESKLWFNGGWWASMFKAGPAEHRIYRLDPTTMNWRDTGMAIDTRASTRADALWDAATGKLYVASHVYTTSGRRAGKGNSGRLYRYSYDGVTGTYSLDPGFPVVINAAKSETLVIDKDSTGTLWATWTQGRPVYVI